MLPLDLDVIVSVLLGFHSFIYSKIMAFLKLSMCSICCTAVMSSLVSF